jgi:hypothetical protein
MHTNLFFQAAESMCWQGSWIIKQAVGSRAVPLGQILDASYHVGLNYIEVCNWYNHIFMPVCVVFLFLPDGGYQEQVNQKMRFSTCITTERNYNMNCLLNHSYFHFVGMWGWPADRFEPRVVRSGTWSHGLGLWLHICSCGWHGIFHKSECVLFFNPSSIL